MKKLRKYFDNVGHTQYHWNMDRSMEGKKAMPFWIVLIMYQVWEVRDIIQITACKVDGHKFAYEETGGPENGPSGYAYCPRCGYEF